MSIKIVHFHNGKEGGVFSVIKNLINFQQSYSIENHIIYVINIDELNDFKIPVLPNAKSQKVFYYSSQFNFYYTCKQLAKLVPNDQAIIIAHDWLELGMVSNLGLNNPVIQILHGDFDYYYELSIKHHLNVDFILCVSSVISENLNKILKSDKVIDWRFPIPDMEKNKILFDTLNIAYFVGDLKEERKNYSILPKIDFILSERKIKVNWLIAGGGLKESENRLLWNQSIDNRMEFYGFLDDIQINELLKKCNAMILPSFKEGLPVSVVEAMKRGVVPFISFWDGAVEGLVIEGETGFYADPLSAEDFADKIEFFIKNKELRNKMCSNAKRRADQIFNPVNSVEVFENIALSLKPSKGIKFKAYGSRLDNEFIPNFMVSLLRKLKRNV
jgi:glycosyltransferase involved in cell wall biosynthesis